MELKHQLKTLRLQHKLTQQQLADKLNINRTSISKYENGIQVPEIDVLKSIAEFFSVSVDFLLGNSSVVKIDSDITKSKKESFTPIITEKDEKDIAKKLEEILDSMNTDDGLMLYNNELDDETRELLIASIERTLRQAKLIAKEKFTPNKYKK